MNQILKFSVCIFKLFHKNRINFGEKPARFKKPQIPVFFWTRVNLNGFLILSLGLERVCGNRFEFGEEKKRVKGLIGELVDCESDGHRASLVYEKLLKGEISGLGVLFLDYCGFNIVLE